MIILSFVRVADNPPGSTGYTAPRNVNGIFTGAVCQKPLRAKLPISTDTPLNPRLLMESSPQPRTRQPEIVADGVRRATLHSGNFFSSHAAKIVRLHDPR